MMLIAEWIMIRWMIISFHVVRCELYTMIGLYDRSTSSVTHQSTRLTPTAQQVLSHFLVSNTGHCLGGCEAAMERERGWSLSWLDGIFGRRSLVAKSTTWNPACSNVLLSTPQLSKCILILSACYCSCIPCCNYFWICSLLQTIRESCPLKPTGSFALVWRSWS